MITVIVFPYHRGHNLLRRLTDKNKDARITKWLKSPILKTDRLKELKRHLPVAQKITTLVPFQAFLGRVPKSGRHDCKCPLPA